MRANRDLVVLGAIVASVVSLLSVVSAATNSPRRVALTSPEGLTPHNVTVAPAKLHGKSGVRVTMTDELRERVRAMTPEELRRAAERGETEQLVILEGFEFGDGVIEAEIAGEAQTSHSAQYIAHPDWTWFRLRREFPEKYESYVDLVPGEWTKIRIEVRGEQARLHVHGARQPTLIVNDVKSGKAARGAIALWIDVGTVAHFRNLVVTP